MPNMATLLKVVSRQGRHLRAIARLTRSEAPVVSVLTQRALISTSGKKKDVTGTVEPMEKSTELKRLSEHFENTDKDSEENYTSYGYDQGDRDTDWFIHHVVMFCTITLGVCGGGFILAYMPDLKLNDWCHREAYLELERREKAGLPLVDPNYANPVTIVLPPNEELGEQEIII